MVNGAQKTVATAMHKATASLIAIMWLKLIFLSFISTFLVFLLPRHRRGRKTKTSSDASQEAPERTRKDTPKEVNCILEQQLFRASLQAKFSGFLATLPMSAVSRLNYAACAGNLFATAKWACAFSVEAPIVYHKIRSADEKSHRSVFRMGRRRCGFPPAGLSGLSQPESA